MADNEISQKDIARMEKKIDEIANALTDPRDGVHVRVARIETKLDAIEKKACEAEAKAEAADKRSEKNRQQLTIQWWLIAAIILALLGIAFGIIEGWILPH